MEMVEEEDQAEALVYDYIVKDGRGSFWQDHTKWVIFHFRPTVQPNGQMLVIKNPLKADNARNCRQSLWFH